MKDRSTLSIWEQLPDLIKDRGLRLTCQRLFLAELLFKDQKNRHVTAIGLVEKAKQQGVNISLATVYNTLHQFVELGVLRQVAIHSKATFFDTNIRDHHHFFNEESGELTDITQDAIGIKKIPKPPADTNIKRVDVVIHLRNRDG